MDMNLMNYAVRLRSGLSLLGVLCAATALVVLAYTWGGNLSVGQFSLIVGMFSTGVSALLVARDHHNTNVQRHEEK